MFRHRLKNEVGSMEKEKTASSSRPKGGRYLREESEKKPSRHKRSNQRLLAWIAGILAVLSLAVFALYVCLRPDRLAGTWRYDEVTAYQFDGKGNGKLTLPDKEYPFSYKIAGGKLSIDFESEAAKDSIYGYALDENQLTLVGGEGDNSITYILTK